MAKKWIAPILRMFGTNWITLFGANLTTISALIIVGFMILGTLGLVDSPYVALMALMVLPGVFIFGLVLIPIGVWIQRRRDRKAGEVVSDIWRQKFPTIDLNNERVRRITTGVVVLSIVNILLISTVAYEGVVYMDSSEFCGEVCHTVMQPEFAAYKVSPHSRVECVECHIGPGAPWFVRAKLSGMGQLIAVTLHTYATPVPTPVHNLRPSQDTCEQCHWPGRFTGDRVRVITRYADDEANTPMKTVLIMHIGGGGQEEGIHSWHINPERQTSYIAIDSQRQEIAWVQVQEDDGIIEFVKGDFSPDSPEAAGYERRVMDCIDCHNRPTHIYQLPDDAMDGSLVSGAIDPSLPYIKKKGVEALTEAAGENGSRSLIGEQIRAFYEQEYPDIATGQKDEIERAIAEMEAIYDRNVFPAMKVSWGTYPNNIGHTDPGHRIFQGCFRCHDSEHESSEGTYIEQDCEACHTILAMEEENPAILEELGL